jgi:serine/threonine-protein kinase
LPAVPGYEIVGLLGRGGMGIVYKARQLGLNRLVALKMAHVGEAGEGELRLRFKAEAEAAARLQHPNIVQIFDVGECDGRPYFAMELLDGGSLEARLGGKPLPARDAACAVEVLARALDVAHRRGVIHRDLKPANILLASAGDGSLSEATLKIADFGLAKQLDTGAGQTLSGAVLGTPAYMAPEQAGGNTAGVGTAADIHALGVLLYEMLTGRPPFNGATLAEVLEQVRTAEPVPPRRLQPTVPRDLETICLKCLQKEPQRRYASAAALAEDLQCFAVGRPIRARPVGRVERGWRWCRRHPGVACLTAALFLAVGGGFAAVLGYWWQAEADRQTAQWQRAEAERQRDRAADNFRLARETVDRYCTFVSEDRLLREPAMEGLRRELLQAAVEFYQGFVRESGNDPAIRLEQGRAYLRLAQLTTEIGRRPEAIRLCTKGSQILEQLTREYPDNRTYLSQLCRLHHELALIHNRGCEFELAIGCLRKELAVQERLAEGRAEDPENLAMRAAILGSLAIAYQGCGQLREAEAVLRDALGQQEHLVAKYPQWPRCRMNLAIVLTLFGSLHLETGRTGKAEPLLCRGLELGAKLDRLQPGERRELDVALAKGRIDLARVHAERGRHREALTVGAQAADDLARLTQAHPLMSEHRRCLAIARFTLARSYAALDRPQEAEPAFREAETILEPLNNEQPREVSYAAWRGLNAYYLGRFYLGTGRLEEAAAAFRKSADIWAKLGRTGIGSKDTRVDHAGALHYLGRCCILLGRPAEAEAPWLTAVNLRRALAREAPAEVDHQCELARNEANLGDWYFRARRPEKSPPFLLAALATCDRWATAGSAVREIDEIRATCWVTLAAAYQSLGRPPDAEQALRKGVPLCEQLTRAGTVDKTQTERLADTWIMAGSVQRGMGLRSQALAAHQQSLPLWERLVAEHPGEVRWTTNLAAVHGAIGDLQGSTNPAAARTAYGHAIHILQGILKQRPDWGARARTLLTGLHVNRAQILLGLNSPGRALQDCDAALVFVDADKHDSVWLSRVAALILAGELTRALEDAERLQNSPSLVPAEVCYLATLYAWCREKIWGNGNLPAVEREPQAERCAAEAVRQLRRAHAAGHFALAAHREWLERAPQLGALRPRADFQALLAAVRRASATPGKGSSVR